MSFLPNAVGIGFAKSGTSFIARVLATHPEICFSRRKETHFFEKSQADLAEYESYFVDYNENRHRVTMEWTVNYIDRSDTLIRIRDVLGENVKLLLCYRDPVEAFTSLYHYNRMLGPKRPERNMSPRECASKMADAYIESYFYDIALERLLGVFKRPRLHIIEHEALTNRPEHVFSELFSFLDVSHSEHWRSMPPVNVSMPYKSQKFDNYLRGALRRIYGESNGKKMYRADYSAKPWIIRQAQKWNEKKIEIDSDLLEELRSIHAPHLDRFHNLLSERNISSK